jgi:alkylation response protein AidB-like acyl-CoA dehydrogenase
MIVLAAVRTGGPGANGISALIIPLNQKGVFCKKLDNSGVHASGSTYIEFDNVEVPLSNLIGKENEGFRIIMSSKSLFAIVRLPLILIPLA